MKYSLTLTIAASLLLAACSTTDKSTATTDTIPAATTATIAITDTVPVSSTDADKTELRGLIQKMLKWSDSDEGHVDLLPAIIKDSICVGFDMTKVDQTATRIKETDMFADEFIDNYKHIMQTLNKNIQKGEFAKWSGDEVPPFNFASDMGPWCSCQDNMPWDGVDITVIKMTDKKAELNWNWGKSGAEVDASWKKAAIPFRASKANGHWKIAYLDGFDYERSITGVK